MPDSSLREPLEQRKLHLSFIIIFKMPADIELLGREYDFSLIFLQDNDASRVCLGVLRLFCSTRISNVSFSLHYRNVIVATVVHSHTQIIY